MEIQKALEEWRALSDFEVCDGDEAHRRYGRNTIASTRVILGALSPTNVAQIQAIVKIANECRVPLYTFSTGHDWGFGSSLPTVDGCVIVDLSGMRRIIECNETLGYVTVEPGVSQEVLYEYFQERGLNFMVPTTGGGPSCSIIGNALEKGYGITPYIDHFGAVVALEAVLPNGDVYRPSFKEFGGHRVNPISKWKVGPYLDGLFVQSNMGIVVQMTVALARKPEHMSQFVAFIDADNFEKAVQSVAAVKERWGSMVGGINVMNDRRVLSMTEQKQWQIEGVVPERHLHELARQRGVSDWVVLVGLYCPREIERAIRRDLRREFAGHARHMTSLNRRKLRWITTLVNLVPAARGLKQTLQSIERSFDVLEGVPSEIALPLAYLKNPHAMPKRGLHPDRDGCGLIWYTPLLPIEGALAKEFVTGIREIFLSEQLEPLITLTAISPQCFYTNIPIIFNRDDPKQCEQARSCFKRMLDFAVKRGLFPDRLDIETMRDLYDNAEGACFALTETIKNALDPNGILSPGRYARLPRA